MIKCLVFESNEEKNEFVIGTMHEILHKSAPHFITDYLYCMELLTEQFKYSKDEADEILDKLNNYYKTVVDNLLDIRKTKKFVDDEVDDEIVVKELDRRLAKTEYAKLHEYLCSLK